MRTIDIHSKHCTLYVLYMYCSSHEGHLISMLYYTLRHCWDKRNLPNVLSCILCVFFHVGHTRKYGIKYKNYLNIYTFNYLLFYASCRSPIMGIFGYNVRWFWTGPVVHLVGAVATKEVHLRKVSKDASAFSSSHSPSHPRRVLCHFHLAWVSYIK